MSKISTVYDAIISKTSTLFPNKTRLHNSYMHTENPEIMLKDAWGIKVGASEYREMEFIKLTTTREFIFTSIRQFATMGNKEDAFDNISKLILEDQQSFLSLIYSTDELGVADSIDQIEIVTISGIEFIQKDQKKYLLCEIAFRITISELI